MSDGMSAFIRSLISPSVAIPEVGDITAGARGWASVHEQRRANQESERLRERGQNVELESIAQQRGAQRERLNFEQEQASLRQAQELHEKRTKAAGELMDAISSEKPARIAVAQLNAQLLGVDMVEDQPEAPPLSGVGPLQGPREGTRMPQDASSGAGTGSGSPDEVDEFGGRMLRPGERPEFAGDEKPPDWLSGYMDRPDKPTPFFAGEQRRPKPTAEPTDIRAPSEEMDKARRGVVLEEEKEPPQANARDLEGPGAPGVPDQGPQAAQVKDATAEPQRQPVAPRGYLLRVDGKTIGHINPEEIRARQREMAAEALSPLLKNARDEVEKHAAIEAIQIGQEQVGKIGLDNALKSAQLRYDKRVGEARKTERNNTAAWARAHQMGQQERRAGEGEFNAFMRRYNDQRNLRATHEAIEAAARGAESIISSNPALQEQAVYEYVRSVNGNGVLSNQDFDRSLRAGGRWLALQAKMKEWTDQGRRPEEWAAMLREAQSIVGEARSEYLHRIGVEAMNEMTLSPFFSQGGPEALERWQARAYQAVTGEVIQRPAQGAPQANQSVAPLRIDQPQKKRRARGFQ